MMRVACVLLLLALLAGCKTGSIAEQHLSPEIRATFKVCRDAGGSLAYWVNVDTNKIYVSCGWIFGEKAGAP